MNGPCRLLNALQGGLLFCCGGTEASERAEGASRGGGGRRRTVRILPANRLPACEELDFSCPQHALSCEHDPLLALDFLQIEPVTGPAHGPECLLSDANRGHWAA